MPANMQQVSLPPLKWTNDNPNLWATVLLYAPARWGKTESIRTCPDPIVIASELGDTSGLQTLMDAKIPFIECPTTETLILIVGELSRQPSAEGVYYQGQGPFRTVVLDSITQTGEHWLDSVKKLKGWDMIWDAGEGDRKDPRSAYPYVAEKGRQVYKLLSRLSANLYIIAREDIQEEGTGKDRITFPVPALPGAKLPRELPGWPDATLRGFFENSNRRIRTRTYNRAVAGFRVPPSFEVPEIILPNIGAIFRLTTGDKTALDLLDPRKAAAVTHVTASPRIVTPNVRKP